MKKAVRRKIGLVVGIERFNEGASFSRSVNSFWTQVKLVRDRTVFGQERIKELWRSRISTMLRWVTLTLHRMKIMSFSASARNLGPA